MVIYPFIAWWFSHEKCWFSSSQTVNVYQFAMRIYNPRSHLVWCCWWGGAKARFFEPLAAIFSSAFMKSDWLGIGTIGTMELYIYIILWLSIGEFHENPSDELFHIFQRGSRHTTNQKCCDFLFDKDMLPQKCLHRMHQQAAGRCRHWICSVTNHQTRSWTQAMEPPKNAMAHVRRSFQTKICAWCRLKMKAPYTLKLQQHFEGCVLLRSGIP